MSVIHVKRQPNNHKTYTEKLKKLRNLWHQGKKSITDIENLSNELFYEIFDYLDGCEIYQSFSSLNLRFQNILASSVLQLKINLSPFLDTDIQHGCMNIISQQREKIISLRLIYTSNIDRFFTFNSSFSRLKSLSIIGIKSDDLFQPLSGLASLPCLLSLVLCVGDNLKCFSDMYKLIFNLPVLKYVTLSSEAYEPCIPLSIATDNQVSTTEHLTINHSCSLHDVVSILSYTPQLNRLNCRELIKSNENMASEAILNLSKLTHICISECYVKFDKLEILIKQISSQLQILRVNTYWDVTYLDTDRWEQLISEHIPHLREFHLQHHEYMDDDFEVTKYHKLINRFTSSFWITRRCIFDLAIDINDWAWSEIIYSVHPYKKKWYELHEMTEMDACFNQDIHETLSGNGMSFIDHLQNIELTITAPFCREFNELCTDNTIALFTLLRITRLDVLFSGILVNTLIDLIDHLPNLDSLRVRSLSLLKPQYEPTSTIHLCSSTNNITKVNIQCLTQLVQIRVLIDLCPNMQYFEIDCPSDIGPKRLTRFILTKKIQYISRLSILCLRIQSANDKMVEELQEMINFEKLCHDYTIKRLCNKIYLLFK